MSERTNEYKLSHHLKITLLSHFASLSSSSVILSYFLHCFSFIFLLFSVIFFPRLCSFCLIIMSFPSTVFIFFICSYSSMLLYWLDLVIFLSFVVSVSPLHHLVLKSLHLQVTVTLVLSSSVSFSVHELSNS